MVKIKDKNKKPKITFETELIYNLTFLISNLTFIISYRFSYIRISGGVGSNVSKKSSGIPVAQNPK